MTTNRTTDTDATLMADAAAGDVASQWAGLNIGSNDDLRELLDGHWGKAPSPIRVEENDVGETRLVGWSEDEWRDLVAERLSRRFRVRWSDLTVYDDDGNEVECEEKAEALREFRDTGSMAGRWFVDTAGMTPEQVAVATNAGPDVEGVDWSGL